MPEGRGRRRLEAAGIATTAAPGSSQFATPSTAREAPTSSGQTCFVGPRGGTYTITRSGKKNYGGC
jgi:hypothetical protein